MSGAGGAGMARWAMRAVMVILLIALGIYLAVCAGLYFGQRSMLYFPVANMHDTPATVGTLAVRGAVLRYSMQLHPGDRAVLYFGGNGEDVSAARGDLARVFPDRAVYLLHYRGYGGSSGQPSEQALLADALAFYDAVHVQHPSISVIGRSLGSGIAVHLAAQRAVERLVLVTPYDSILELAVQRYPLVPVRWLLKERYETWRDAVRVRAPTVIIAADDDEIIPEWSSRKLLSRFPPGRATYHAIANADHNSISTMPVYADLLRGPP